MFTTIVATTVLIAILFFAIRYIIKEKKKGVKCIGCPDAGSCNSNSCCNIDYDEIIENIRMQNK